MLGGASKRTTPSVRGQERGLIDAIGDPVEVPLDAPDVVPLLVESRAERRLRHGRVVGQGVGRSGRCRSCRV